MPIFSKQNKAQLFFDGLSSLYDVINPLVYPSSMRDELLSHVEGERILDFGVGTGYTTGKFAGAVGIDLSMKMMRRAKDYRGQLMRADILRPPFKGERFDTIISAGSFYYLPDPREGLKSFHYLLRDGGIVLILSPNTALSLFKPLIHIYTHQDYNNFFNETGFSSEIVKTTASRRYICFCKARKKIGEHNGQQ